MTRGHSLVHAMLDRSVIFGIGLMIALLGVGAVGSYRNIQAVQQHSQQLAHTHEVDRIAADLLRKATDAVAHERGHLLGGDERSERACRDALSQLLAQHQLLLDETKDSPSQTQRLKELLESLEKLREELLRGLQLRGQGAGQEELSVASNAASELLQPINDQIAVIRREESQLLQDREDDVSAALRTALFSGVILFGLGMTLFMGIIELVRRNAAAQQRQQERLFAEREQLSVTLASIDDTVISLDRMGRISHWNGPAERLTGQLRERAVGNMLPSMLQLRDEITMVEVALPLEEILRPGAMPKFDSPCVVMGKDGETHPVSVHLSPILDNSGKMNGAVLVLRELNEERRAEMGRIERARILSIRADVGLIIGHAGRTATQLQQCVDCIARELSTLAVGLWTHTDPTSDLMHLVATQAQPGWSLVEESVFPPAGSALEAAIQQRDIVQKFCRVNASELHNDDSTRPTEVAVWVCPLTIEDRVLGILAVYTIKPLSEMSSSELCLLGVKLAQFIERRAIEEARQASEELFRTLANSIPQLAWMARPDGNIFWYNQRWFDYTGTTMEQMQGWGWQAVHDPAELPHVVESIRHSFLTGEPWEDTFPLRRHDGEYRWHLSRMLPIRDEHGRIRLWFGTNTDVTEQRTSQNRLRRVIDSMFAFVGIIAEDGTLIEANQPPLIAAGITRDDVIGRKFWDCHWWQHSDEVRGRLQDAFTRAVSGELVRYDEEMQLQDQTRVTIDLMLQPVYEDGQLLFVIQSGVDVTARKRAEERVAHSEEFLRSVLDALASHIAVLDDRGVILMVNQAWKDFADLNAFVSSAYEVGQNYLEMSSSADGPRLTEDLAAVQGIRDVIDGKLPSFSMEYPCHSPTEQCWFQMRVDRFTTAGSTRVVVSHENITTRVLSEQATQWWSTQHQQLAEIAFDLSAAENIQSAMDVVTSRARRLFGAVAAETIRSSETDDHPRRTVSSERDGDVFASVALHADAVRRRVQSSNRPLRVTAAQPQEQLPGEASAITSGLATRCIAAPLTNRDGHNIGLIQLRGKRDGDYTADDEAILIQLAQMASVALERARLYDEILIADQRKDQFLATLAHELRNPLSALTAGAQLIIYDPKNPAQVKSTAEMVARQCAHLKQLVDDLLDVSRISRGKLNLHLASTKMQDVIQHALDTARAAINDAGHTLITQIHPEPLIVEGDAVRLAQVVSNLLVNAAKYTPRGGRIELELSAENDLAVVSVRDNGIGIPPEMIDSIFDLFTQVDSSHTRSQGGLGIGLTLARTLVSMHGGQIKVSSPGKDQGSTFTVRIPLASTSSAETSAPSALAVPHPQKPYRILAVDDNRAAVHLLARLLSTLGHDVRIAGDGMSALSTILAFQPEIVISDIGMPDMSGYDLAQHIRELDGITQPVLVALTGYGQESDRRAASDAGFSHHLTKPVSVADLEVLLRAIAV